MKSLISYILGLLIMETLGVRSEIDFTQNRITLMPPNKDYVKSVDEGHFVTCEGDADDNLKWLKPDGMEVDVQSKSRVHQMKVNGKLQLVFVYVSKEDQGEWSCVSNFEDGGDGKSFTMNVYVPISFEIIEPTVEAKETEDVVVPCEVYGLPEPTVNWYYDGDNLGELLLNESGKYKRLADGLLIQKLRYEDSGEYTCKAYQITEIMTNIKEQTIQLNVQYKPVMTGHAHKKVFGFVNGDVEMQCDAHGLPRPEFIWFRGGRRISLKNIKSIDNHSTLRVHIKTKEDFGEYKCKAKNDLGHSEQTILITEGKKPEMPTTFYNRGSSTDTFVIDVGAKVDPKTQNSMSINGYRFELIPKHKFEKQKSWNGSWVKEFAIADGATYLLTPVSENTTYMIRVASKNSAGYSDYTETLYETTIPKYPMIFPSNCSPFLSPMITLIMLVLYLLV